MTQLPSSKREQSPPIFGICLLWPNGCTDQDATWYGGWPRPRPHCARWGPSSPPQKGGRAPNFRPMFLMAKQLDGSRCRLVRSLEGRSRPRPHCCMGTQLPLPKWAQPPIFGTCLLWPNGRLSQLLVSTWCDIFGYFLQNLVVIATSLRSLRSERSCDWPTTKTPF